MENKKELTENEIQEMELFRQIEEDDRDNAARIIEREEVFSDERD